MHFFAIRRARLRPEYARLYPRLVPHIWIGARTAARSVRRANRGLGILELQGRRILPDAHFEFRGGGDQLLERGDVRTRAGDTVAPQPAGNAPWDWDSGLSDTA